MVEFKHSIGPCVDVVGPALDRQGNKPILYFHTPINVGAFWSNLYFMVWDSGYFWYKVLYTTHRFVYMAV